MEIILQKCQSSRMEFLRKLRESRGLTRYAMAKKLGLIQQTYIHYEEKAAGIKLDTLARIRQALGLSWDELGAMIDNEVKKKKKSSG